MEISKKLIDKIVKDVKNKKELSKIGDLFVRNNVEKELKKRHKLTKFLSEHEFRTVDRSSKYKNFIKLIRAELRKIYGLFETKDSTKREEFLKKKDYKSILKSHLSTKERYDFYPEIYKKIWKITGKPKSILDLACGMNPFSFEYMNLKDVNYFAVELSKEDSNFIQNYFNQNKKINGKSKAMNLLNIKDFEFPKSDIAFIFKFLDPAIIKNKKFAEQFLKKIPAKYIIVSFSTETISKKPMRNPRRKWFENICKNLDFEIKKILEFKNEIFYVIKK